MSFEQVIQEIRVYEKSSGYRYGDRTTFSVRLAPGLVLKGPNSASGYLDSLGLSELPERVMVIHPGNGGLVTECYNRGAKRVICVEPRARFSVSLRRILGFQEQIWDANGDDDLSYRIVDRWEQVEENDGFKDVDLILFPEGLAEISQPKAIFTIIATALNPGGSLMLEVQHGRHPWVEKINSWHPSEHAVLDMSKEIFGGPWAEKRPGRHGQNSSLFVLQKPQAEGSLGYEPGLREIPEEPQTADEVDELPAGGELVAEEDLPFILLDDIMEDGDAEWEDSEE